MMATTETLRGVLRTSRGQPILKLQSAEQRASFALDLLSLGSRAVLGISFLLSVSDRLGFYGNPGERGVSWGTFERFLGSRGRERHSPEVSICAGRFIGPGDGSDLLSRSSRDALACSCTRYSARARMHRPPVGTDRAGNSRLCRIRSHNIALRCQSCIRA